ncbi:hypothetical protein CI105_08880 [Candidatus Izimaplasma bacterium ZiA1]|nr:hypothetical protein CI105_08880 [Candidatus Izimaplasma bacterium ZiA1]
MFEIEVLVPAKYDSDSKALGDNKDITATSKDGRKVLVHSYKYERNPANRKRAIEYHGTTCHVCGFDFFEKYGKLGEGFIEVHHRVPLYMENGEPINVNPIKDLVPVCSNCHRMLHRSRKNPISIYGLTKLMDDLK